MHVLDVRFLDAAFSKNSDVSKTVVVVDFPKWPYIVGSIPKFW